MGAQAKLRVPMGQVSACPEQRGPRRRMWEACAPWFGVMGCDTIG